MSSETRIGSEALQKNAALGSHNLVGRLGLDSSQWTESLKRIEAQIAEQQIKTVRVSCSDVHGIVRARPIESRHFAQVARNGMPTTTAILAMDSANNIVLPVFEADCGLGRHDMGGGGDMYLLPDLATFRVLPWAPDSAMVLSDIYLRSGDRCPFDPRFVMQRACQALAQEGLSFVAGIELECAIFKVDNHHRDMGSCGMPANPPSVFAPQHAYQYFSSDVVDGAAPLIESLRQSLLGIGLPLRMIEPEWGPGQIEITTDPLSSIDAADAMVFLRTAVKQVSSRLGMIASFMATPGLPNAFSSGWHLHQSLAHIDGGINAFMDSKQLISDLGRRYVGGLIEHFAAGAAFSNPTINGYKRLNASPLSPKYATWSHNNKGAMVRLIGGPGDRGTHLENRVGEPAANPYLYMASQAVAGLDGILSGTDPGDPVADPRAISDKPVMPMDLVHAIEALEQSRLYRKAFGDEFVDYYLRISRGAIRRFLSTVTDWEHREYFERF